MKEVRDPEYEKVIARAYAVVGFAVLGTIGVCLFRIVQTMLQF